MVHAKRRTVGLSRRKKANLRLRYHPQTIVVYDLSRQTFCEPRFYMTGDTCDRNRPAGCRRVVQRTLHRDRKFALLNRARLRSSFDRTVLRELSSESREYRIFCQNRHIFIATMLFSSSQTSLLFIIVTVRFKERSRRNALNRAAIFQLTFLLRLTPCEFRSSFYSSLV